MTDRTPTRTTNLDRYGFDALPWSRAHAELVKGSTGPDITHFLGGPDAAGEVISATYGRANLVSSSAPKGLSSDPARLRQQHLYRRDDRAWQAQRYCP